MMRAKIATCALLLACSVQLNAASLPGQGASMSQVEQEFGSPLSKTGAVGTPPITRWTYDGFVVVFERNKVLHSMTVTGQRPAPRPATPVRAPAPAPVKAPAPVAPAPAAVQKPATPAATPVTPTQADSAEQARRKAERDAAKARADADAAKARAAEEAAAAEALRKPVEPAPEAATPQAAPAPAATPAPEAAPAPKRTTEDALKAAPGFSFDPATGRVILK
ncbi:MAG: hypothetical protein Q7T32_14170 [Moraxellaceae bacterium]|nr:hypothetical protein [Moraxellaceae bacterium]